MSAIFQGVKPVLTGLLSASLLVTGLNAGRGDERLSATTKVSLVAVGAVLASVIGYKLYQRYLGGSVVSAVTDPAAFAKTFGIYQANYRLLKDKLLAPAAVDDQEQIQADLAALETNLKWFNAQRQQPEVQQFLNRALHNVMQQARDLGQASFAATPTDDAAQTVPGWEYARQQAKNLVIMLLDHGADIYSMVDDETVLHLLPYDNDFVRTLLTNYCTQSPVDLPGSSWLDYKDHRHQTAIEHYLAVRDDRQAHLTARDNAGHIANQLRALEQCWSGASAPVRPTRPMAAAAAAAGGDVTNTQTTSALTSGHTITTSPIQPVVTSDSGTRPATAQTDNQSAAGASANASDTSTANLVPPVITGDGQAHQVASAEQPVSQPANPVVEASASAASGAEPDSESDDEEEFFDAQPLLELPEAEQQRLATEQARAAAVAAEQAQRALEAERTRQELAAWRVSVAKGDELIAAARRTSPAALTTALELPIGPATSMRVADSVPGASAVELSVPVTNGHIANGHDVSESKGAAVGVGPAAAITPARIARASLTTTQQADVDNKLLYAARTLNFAQVQAAVQAGADVNVIASGLRGPLYDWSTPLELAAGSIERAEQLPILEYLVKQGARVCRPTGITHWLGLSQMTSYYSVLAKAYRLVRKAPALVAPFLRIIGVGFKRDFTVKQRRDWLAEKHFKLIGPDGKPVKFIDALRAQDEFGTLATMINLWLPRDIDVQISAEIRAALENLGD